MDCLAGRKTTGQVVGDVRVSGHPKVQETFARVTGYVEQSDIHSAHITVLESLVFSARLRFTPDVRRDIVFAFVQEVRAENPEYETLTLFETLLCADCGARLRFTPDVRRGIVFAVLQEVRAETP